MVGVTERAKEVLLERRRRANIGERQAGLRVLLDQTGRWVLVADRLHANDLVVFHAGAPLLLMDKDAQRALAGVLVDCLETPDGAGLLLTRPEGGGGQQGTERERLVKAARRRR
jgi:hypothetical protein